MANKIAKYDNPHTRQIVSRWFETKHGNRYEGLGDMSDVLSLYQSYHEYTTFRNHQFDRVDVDAFVKLLVACKILRIGSWWEYRPNYEPKRYEITRANYVRTDK